MSFLDKIKEGLMGDKLGVNPTEDYFRRNSGKKIPATVLEPTEQELKELTETAQ